MTNKIFPLTLIAIGAAIIAVLSPLTLPLGVIPLTLQTLAVGLIATILRPRETFFAILIYILLGLVGLPIFQGGTAGLTEFLSPRGGYLVGFLIVGPLISWLLGKVDYKMKSVLIINILCHLLLLVIGTLWLKFYMGTDFKNAFALGFLPFILVELLKATLVTIIGLGILRILKRQNSYFNH